MVAVIQYIQQIIKTSPWTLYLKIPFSSFSSLKVSEKEMSTVLLVFPELGLFGDYELFEGYCER